MEATEEDTLEQQALDEILKDIKRGAERAREHGALGWQKNPGPVPNKTFLRNMLVSTLRDDNRGRRGFRQRGNHRFHRGGDSSYDKGLKRHYSDSRSSDQKSSKDFGEENRNSDHMSSRSPEKSRRLGTRKKRRSESDEHESNKVENGQDTSRGAEERRQRTEHSDNEERAGKKHKKSKKSKKHKSKKSSHKKRHKK